MNYEIKTERLVLRPLDISDLETVHIYASDKENTVYMCYLPNSTIEETKNFLNNVTREWKKEYPSYYEFAIVYDNIQIGAISIYLDAKREIGELGWILNKRYWHQGIAFEAAVAIKGFAISTLKLQKIIAYCDYRNTASYRLMRKIGMTLESDKGTRIYSKNAETAQELIYLLIV